MRIILQVSTLGHKTYHSLAKRIKEIYPESHFSIPGGSKMVLEFFQNQDDIKYEIFETAWRSTNQILTEKDVIDYEELNKIEHFLSSKSLWLSISGDRGIGRAFLSGAIGYENYRSFDRETILRVCSKAIMRIRQHFERFRPDVFIPALAMGDVGVWLYEAICREMGVLYLLPSFMRVSNYVGFSSVPEIDFPQVKSYYNVLINGDSGLKGQRAEDLLDELITGLHEPDMNPRHKKMQFRNKLHREIYRFGFIAYIMLKFFYRTVVLLFHIIFKSKKIEKTSIFGVFLYLKYNVLRGFQRLRLTSINFGTKAYLNKKYIYFPLPTQPEYTNNIMGVRWMNTTNLIETLAKNIPHDWVVYVKEHPGLLSDRIRPLRFHREIDKLPNVFHAPLYTPSLEMISNAQMVAVVTGTAGWEAILLNKPVIEFRSNEWSMMGLSSKCTDIEKLSFVMHNELERMRNISLSERMRRLLCYLEAVVENGFTITYPTVFSYGKKGTDEEYKVCGHELAEGFFKHLLYLEENEGYKF